MNCTMRRNLLVPLFKNIAFCTILHGIQPKDPALYSILAITAPPALQVTNPFEISL